MGVSRDSLLLYGGLNLFDSHRRCCFFVHLSLFLCRFLEPHGGVLRENGAILLFGACSR